MKKYIKLDQKGAIPLLILLATIGLLGFLLIINTFNFKDKLFSSLFLKPSSHAAGPINYYGRTVQTFGIFGQKDFMGATRNAVTSSTAYHAAGTIVDSRNHVYVVDKGNNRILGFLDGNGTNKAADIIIGQPDFSSGNCNGDDNLGFKKAPTAATLCLFGYPTLHNTAEESNARSIAVDTAGNLFVPDIFNNRVLEYFQPFSADKSGGKGDGIADFVYGQPDMSTNLPNGGDYNKAITNPTTVAPATNNILSLCCGTGGGIALGVGVGVDPFDNSVWVADVGNSRILRFPYLSKTPDVILGKQDCSRAGNVNLDTLCRPIAVGVSPAHELYVLDNLDDAYARFLVFTPDGSGNFKSGQIASRTFKPNVAKTANDAGWFDQYGYIFQANGFSINKDTTNYPNGMVWVNEFGKRRTLLLDKDGNVVTVLLATAADRQGGSQGGCGIQVGPYQVAEWPNGSIGQDSSGNIYLAFEYGNMVVRLNPTANGNTCPPQANGSLLGGDTFSMSSLDESLGVAAYQNQLIVSSGNYKYKVWNDYKNKPFGAPADYVISDPDSRNYINSSIDDKGRLWIANSHRELQIWQLPITSSNNAPIKNFEQFGQPIPSLYWANDQTPLANYWIGESTAFDPINKAMYISQGTRILRVKNYDDFNNKLYVDMVIGQNDKINTNCNQGLGTPNAGTLCNANQIAFDKLGNLYVVDDDFECHSNARIVVFMADDLRNAAGMFPNLQAKLVFNQPDFSAGVQCEKKDTLNTPISLAFNAKNQLVVGDDGYYWGPDYDKRELKQLWFFADPLHKQTPDATINLYMGSSGGLEFDDEDNLLVMDHTWYRVHMINLCTDPSWLEWLPGVIPVSTCSPLPSPTTPAPTATPTPTPTPTPIPSPSDTTPPTVSITNPLNGATVKAASKVNITASASDNIRVTKVEFYIGNSLKCSVLSGPYSCTWSVPGKKNSSYTITAKAYDGTNNTNSATSKVTAN